jgi:hypothetical protein
MKLHTPSTTALSTFQLVLVHAEHLICPETCRLSNSEKHAQIHAPLSIQTNACGGIMTESPGALGHAHSCSTFDTGPHMMISPPAPDTNWQMQVHAKLSINAETCVHALSSQYWPTYLKMIHQLPINAERCQTLNTRKHMLAHSPLLIRSNACSHTLSPQCVQTHAKACLALEKHKCTQIHARLLIRADTCAHALHSWCRQTNKDTRSALKMCRYIHTHAQLSRHMQAHAQLSTQETEWWHTLRSRNMPTNAQLSRWHTLSTWGYTLSSQNLPINKAPADDIRSAHAGTRSALNTGNWKKTQLSCRNMPTNAQLLSHMQTNAQLLLQANEWRYTLISWYEQTTCRYLLSSWYKQTHAETCKAWDTCIHMQAFNTCMYMHSVNTCRCI